MLSSGTSSKIPLQDTEIAEQSNNLNKTEPSKYELVEFEGPSDKENPKNWSVWTKIRVTGIVIWLSLNVTISSSASTTAIFALADEFNVSTEISTLVVSVFLIGYVFGPILWSGLSENHGRSMIYIGTTTAYILFSLGQPLARNIETLLVTRFFAGLFASASLTVPAGSIADIWEPVGRGRAVSIYSATVFAGPILGPIIGGFVVSSRLGWKWVFWIPIILAAAALPFIVFTLPETCAPAILSRKAKRLRKSGHPFAYSQQEIDAKETAASLRDVLNRTILRPFIMLSLEPILILITLYSSIVYGLIYGLFEAIPIIFSEIRGISTELTGLMFFALGIGTTTGAYLTFLDGRRWLDLTPKWRGTPPPEERLRLAVPGGPLLVIAVFWLGWAGAYRAVPWYAVVLSLIPLGTGITLLGVTFQAYLVDVYLTYAASALCGTTMLRSSFGAAFPLFTPQLFHKLGTQWACTLIGCLMLILAPIPYVFRRYGPHIRTRSKFAPCMDLKIRNEVLGGKEVE